jgi:hybrid cluster-associated redox disulfide protein
MKNLKTKKRNSKTDVKKIKKNPEITKDMTFIEVMNTSPEAAWILMENGMQCAGCGLAASESLEQGALAHGIDPEKLIKRLNKGIKK